MNALTLFQHRISSGVQALEVTRWMFAQDVLITSVYMQV